MTNDNGMWQRLNSRGGHYALLLAVAAAVTLPNLGAPSLWDIDEGHNGEAAREMRESGNWITPTFNFELRSDKPALLYWLQVAGYYLFGVGEFAARLPSALAALLTVLLTYELGRRLFGPSTGLLAGLMLSSAAMFCAAAHFANPDALLNACTLLTFFFFWQSFPRGGWGWLVLPGISMALGVLAKGPVGLVLPGTVIWLFLIGSGQCRRLLDRRVFLGVAAFLLVVLPWCILVGAETKGVFLKEFMGKHNLDRYRAPMEQHGGPVYYYLVTLFLGFAPWSVLLGPTLWYAWKGEADGQQRQRTGIGPLLTLAALVGALYGGLHGYGLGISACKGEGNAFAAQLPGATIWTFLQLGSMMVLGAVAGVTGTWGLVLLSRRYWSQPAGPLTDSPPQPAATLAAAPAPPGVPTMTYRFLWCWIAVYVVFFSLSGTKLPNYILPIYPAVALLTARFLDRWWTGALQLPDWVLQSCLALLAPVGIGISLGLLCVGGAIDLPALRGRQLAGLEFWAFLGALPVLGGAVASWCLRRQARGGVVLTMGTMAVLFMGALAAWGAPALDAYKAPRTLVQAAHADQTDAEIRVACYQYYQPSLVFYCRREVSFMKAQAEALEFLQAPLPVFLFVPAKAWQELRPNVSGTCRLVGQHYDLYRNCEVVVVTNR